MMDKMLAERIEDAKKKKEKENKKPKASNNNSANDDEQCREIGYQKTRKIDRER